MKIKLRRTEDVDLVRALHMLCLPGDDIDLDGQLWIAHDEYGSPAAFCAARKIVGENAVFLSRSGVLPAYRCEGLQRRMIQARIRWAREIGADSVVTYTMYNNWASIVNLLKCGFLFYRPQYQWAGSDVHYFFKAL